MATIAQLLKKRWGKHTEEKAEKERHENPLDTELPLGLHIDGKIEITSVELLVSSESLAFSGENGSYIVRSFGVATLFGQKVYKVYITPESGDDDTPCSYLFLTGVGEDLEIRWFFETDVVTPQTESDWEFWLGSREGMIGWESFQLKTDGERLFDRVWGASEETHVPPYSFEETITPDRYDPAKRVRVQHRCMLYGRDVVGSDSQASEYCLVSAQKMSEGDVIAIDAGIDLTVSDINVVY